MTSGQRLQAVEKLGQQMTDMFNASGLDTNAQVIVLFDLLLTALTSIKCGECRRLQADAIQDMIPEMLAEALSRPTVREHIHEPRAAAPPMVEKLRGPDSTKWDRLSLHYRKHHPLCEMCLREGKITEAYAVDHITPHRGNPRLLFDVTNLQAICQHTTTQ